MPTKKELLEALKNAQGELRRSGSSALRALSSLTAADDDAPATEDNQPTDASGAPIQFDGVANPEPPKVSPSDGETIPAIDTVDPESDEEREKRNTTFPAPVTNPDIQNRAEYTKAEALPSSEVNEFNALDPVFGPLPANPEPAKPGPNEQPPEVIEGQVASEPEVDKEVEEAPESKDHTSASVPTDVPEGSEETATIGEDPGVGEAGGDTDPDTAAGIYEGTANVEAAEAGFPGATEAAKEKNEAILNEGTDVTTGGTPDDTKPAEQEADDTDES